MLTRRAWVILGTIAMALLPFAFAPASMEQRLAPAGAIPLFNGKDLSGWKAFVDPKAKTDAPNNWTVKDGVIVCDGAVNGYLATEKEFENYVLRLEWRWGQKVTRKNRYSSVFVHVTGPDKIWPKGADVTLGANAAGQFWLVDGYQLKIDPARRDPKNERHYFAIEKDTDKPLGEWNLCEVTCAKDTIRVRINGKFVNEGTNASPSKGRIVLLSEGAEIHFRNIELTPLP